MSKLDFLDVLNRYSVEEFIEFLKINGLGEFETLALSKSIDGNTFLNLACFEINNWRPLVNTQQANKFCFFLQQVKRSPDRFAFVTRAPVTSPSREGDQKPTRNPDLLNSLRAAIESHVVGRKMEENRHSCSDPRYINGFGMNRSLPEIPRALPPLSPTNKHSPLRKLASTPVPSREINQISFKFRPSAPNFQGSSTDAGGICKVLPKPPKSFPRIDSLDSADSPNPPPTETRNYHRHTDWEGAEELLSEEVEDGTYIVRPSKTYHSALSVRQAGKVYHIGVKKIEDGIFEVMSAGLELKFRSLRQMVAYFRMHPISVRDKRNNIVDIYLNKALPFRERDA